MQRRGKRSGYKGWVRKSVKNYELYLRKTGQKIGYARIFKSGEKWVGEIYTDVKGLFSQPKHSDSYQYFHEALDWVNAQRKFVSKKLFG